MWLGFIDNRNLAVYDYIEIADKDYIETIVGEAKKLNLGSKCLKPWPLVGVPRLFLLSMLLTLGSWLRRQAL
mgnify:CR=1 FL=1|jgi:hypothetical protein